MRAFASIGLTILCLLLPHADGLQASDLVGIYALVDKVVLEPNERSPERIQIWGVFATSPDMTPKRGYMYFRLPSEAPAVNQIAQKEWADLRAVATTGQTVAFGQRFFPMIYHDQGTAYAQTLGRVRPPSEQPGEPDRYPVNIGLSRLTDTALLNKLKAVK